MAIETVGQLTDLTAQVAVVTGGARGIGQGIALRLAEAGAFVYLVDLNGPSAEAAADELKTQGYQAAGLTVDVSDVASIETLVQTIVARSGRIDVLVNNAGIFPFSPMLDTSEELWDRVLDVNLKGAFFASQAVARQMAKQGPGGRIVNIASIDAFHPSGSLVHYDASKGGMVMMTKSLAAELAPHGIRVNAVAPGAINTPGAQAGSAAVLASGVSAKDLASSFMARIPLKRMGEPDDIARAVLFFATSLSDYATGASLVVDGGYLLS